MHKLIHLLTFLFFLTGSMYVTFPLVFHLQDSLPGLGDELLITWILNWNIHALQHDILHIFNANIFYPFNNSLAFSDTHFISSVIGFFFSFISSEPTFIFNVNVIFSLTTLGFFTYLLVYILTKNIYAALVSGTLVAFSTFTVNKIVHLQVLSIQWIPLSLLFFIKFLEEKKHRFLGISLFFFVLQVYNSFLPGYFLLVCYALILFMYVIMSKSHIRFILTPKTIVFLIITCAVVFPIVLPYISVSQEFNYVRDIRDTIHTANRPEYFLYSYGKTRLGELFRDIVYNNNTGPYFYDGYLGMGVIIAIVVLVLFTFSKKEKTLRLKTLVGISFISFILSLGPALQWGGKVLKIPFIIPLPYALFYYIAPGFKGFRNSGRWEMLTVFGLSVAVGLVLAALFKSKQKSAIVSILFCSLVFLEYDFPMKIKKIEKKSEFPPVYSFIQTLPQNSAIIELPMYNWNMFKYSHFELKRMYYNTLHFKPTVNGHSGFSPDQWQQKTYEFMLNFPNEHLLRWLKENKIQFIILHKNEYKGLDRDKFRINNKPVVTWETLYGKLNDKVDILFMKQIGDDYIYKIL